MTLVEVAELAAYWAVHPPAHIALAALLGIRPRGAAAAPQAMPQILSALGPGFAAGPVDAGLPPVVLDFAELARRAAPARSRDGRS